MRWSEVRTRLLPQSGVGVVSPWLVIAPPGNPVIRVDLRLLDSIGFRDDDDDAGNDGNQNGESAQEEPASDRRCELILSCNELEVAVYIADGREAVERVINDAKPLTREGPSERAVPVPLGAETLADDLTEHGRLVVLESNLAGMELVLTRPHMTIGRTDDNDIVIPHRTISRTHARITRDPSNGRYVLSDLAATNTVRVNGQDCRGVELRHDDVVDLGHVRMRFLDPSADFVIECSMPPDPTSFVIVGGDAVLQQDEFLLVGTLKFRIDEVRDYALHGANLPLNNGALLQAAMAMLVVAASERDAASA